jgi:hypothetical protein
MVKDKQTNTKERRRSCRISAKEALPQAITRLASGLEVELINIGINGSLLIKTKKMLSPGSYIRLSLEASSKDLVLEGRVLRCKVIGVQLSEVGFEAAIILNNGLPAQLVELLGPSIERELSSTQMSTQEEAPGSASSPPTAELWVLDIDR